MGAVSTSSMSRETSVIGRPNEERELKTFLEAHRSEQQRNEPYEIKLGGSRSADWEHDRALMKALAKAGVTWWVEYVPTSSAEEMRERVKRGPLRVE